jgi:hypothetical protein
MIRTTGLLGVVAAFLATPPARAVDITSPGGYLFDVQDSGTGGLLNGSVDAYDGYCYSLRINTVEYNAGAPGALDASGRTVTMATVSMSASLRVSRQAHVPATGSDYIRYVDKIENTGTAAATVAVQYYCDLGSDYGTVVWGSSSGDTTVTADDTWFGTDDSDGSGDPTLAHAYFGAEASVTPTSQVHTSGITTVDFSVTIDPGRTVALIIFGFQSGSQATVRTQVDALLADVMGALADVPGGDLGLVVNWPLHVRWDPAAPFEVPEGGEASLSVIVDDPEGDAVVSWDLDGDDAYDDGEGATVAFSAAGLDGPSTIDVGVSVVDGSYTGEMRRPLAIANANPEITTEPAVLELLRGQPWTYEVAATDPAGELDTLQIELAAAPEGMIAGADWTVSWTPDDTEEVVGEHAVTVRVTDEDGGAAEQSFTLTVIPNNPPSEPTIVSPDRTSVSTLRPTLVVGNSTDEDGDPLTYVFQVDARGTFTGDEVVDSGPVAEGSGGQTSWTLPVDLAPRRYYWRVWADDGKSRGRAANSWFQVQTGSTSDGGTDGGDGGADGGGDGADEGGGGCSCGSPGAAAPASLIAALTLLGATTAGGRRRGRAGGAAAGRGGTTGREGATEGRRR